VKFLPRVSVIIPTFNRKESLRKTLDSLASQTWPADKFEVILVDDDSTDGTKEITLEDFPFPLRYFWQTNQGDAAARNTGARQSRADILVFLDDDIVADKEYLAGIVQEHGQFEKRIVVGTEYLWLDEKDPNSVDSPLPVNPDDEISSIELPFAQVCSNNMSIRRQAYFDVGGMESLEFPGSSIWCDVDFSYRAYLKGFEFRRSTKAICWHRDYVARSLKNKKKRMRQAAFRAVYLFEKYPELLPYLPMFEDKTPIAWHKDSSVVIVKKLARHLASSLPALWIMEKIVFTLEKSTPSSSFRFHLDRWIVGSQIYLGYREGLREFRRVKSLEGRELSRSKS
jgi:glycosyltransferase involved in cell wall biosynthesis